MDLPRLKLLLWQEGEEQYKVIEQAVMWIKELKTIDPNHVDPKKREQAMRLSKKIKQLEWEDWSDIQIYQLYQKLALLLDKKDLASSIEYIIDILSQDRSDEDDSS